jgi:signal transduction histidine kinase
MARTRRQRIVPPSPAPVRRSSRHQGALGTAPAKRVAGPAALDVAGVPDHTRVEEKLRRSEAYLAESERLSHAGTWAWNVSSGEVFWSVEHFRICGVDPQRFTPTIDTAQGVIHPDDRAATMQALYSAKDSGKRFERHLRVVRPDGTIRHVHSLAHPVFNVNGELTEYVGAIVDLTDRKRMEDELRRSEAYLAEGQRLTRTGSWGWNVNTGDIYWSQEQFRIFDRDPLRGAPSIEATFELIHPDDRDSVHRAFEAVVRGGTDHHWDCRIVAPDGTIKHIHTTAHPVFESGPLAEVVGTIVDTTERAHAEEERALLLGRLITAHEEERARISREMHDQFGLHLSALALEIAALRRTCHRQRALCEQVDSLDALVQQLDADIEFLVWSLRPTALDDLGLPAACSHLVTSWVKRVGIHVDLHTRGMGEDRLSRDLETMLYRVLQEALTNIAKHAAATNVSVLLERRGDLVSLIVEDDGNGFDETALSLAHGARLGLLGMRERAAIVGGKVEIESQPGVGTTIAVRVPAPAALRHDPGLRPTQTNMGRTG